MFRGVFLGISLWEVPMSWCPRVGESSWESDCAMDKLWGRDQDLLEASRSGDLAVIAKLLAHLTKHRKSGPLGFASLQARWVVHLLPFRSNVKKKDGSLLSHGAHVQFI